MNDSELDNRWAGIVGLVLYVATGLFPYLSSALLVPLPGLVALMFCWGVGLALTIRVARRRPVWALAAAPIALAFWWIFLTLGEALFGWTG